MNRRVAQECQSAGVARVSRSTPIPIRAIASPLSQASARQIVFEWPRRRVVVALIPSVPTDGTDSFVLVNAHVPLCTVSGVDGEGLQADHDGLVRVDIVIRDGKVSTFRPLALATP